MSRQVAAPRGGAPRGQIALPMGNAGVVSRVLVALLVLDGLKVLIRFVVVATAPMGALLDLLAVYNALAAAPFALWAMNGPPRPTTPGGAWRRAVLTTLAVQLGLALPDTAMYVGELAARADLVQVVLQVIIQSASWVLIGLIELALVSAAGYGILKLRMPRAAKPRAGRPAAPPAAPPRRTQ